MQINRKSFGTLKSDRYGRVPVMDEWPLRQVLLYCDIFRCGYFSPVSYIYAKRKSIQKYFK